jgi:phospholipid/cholesterol/gamma-HCH transport system substrate-binding protein
METKANYVLIGAFVFLAAGALALFTLWIAGNPFSRSFEDYDVVFSGPVNGLSEGGEVRFNGIKVGEVTTLRLDRQDPNRVIAHIRVEAQTPVRTDSVAQLNFQGITGVTFIQILAGDPSAPLLESVNGEVPQIPTSRTLVDELFQGGQDLLGVSGDTIRKINELLSDENLLHLSSTLSGIDKAVNKIAADDGVLDEATRAMAKINTAVEALETAARSFDTAATSLTTDFHSLSTDASSAIQKLDPVLDDARAAMKNLNETVTAINKDVTPAASRAIRQVGHSAADFRIILQRLENVLGEIEQDPSQFIYQQPSPVER